MLTVQNLVVTCSSGCCILNGVSFSLAPGELVGLLGPNGAGKSTLVKAMVGLMTPSQGAVTFEGLPLRQQLHRVAYVPQRSQIDWHYPVTVWNVVMMARTVATGWFREPSRQSRALAQQALERVDLWPLRHRSIGELSGGQQQRVFLARALAQQADLFFFDEPFTAVDKRAEEILFQVFAELKAEGKTLLVISHDLGETLEHYDRLLLLNQKLIAYGYRQEVLTAENLRLAYGWSQSLPLSA